MPKVDIGRRGFFQALGGSTAAAAALADLPEPTKIESLKHGGVYTLKFDSCLTPAAHRSIQESLAPFTEATGCRFLILDQHMTLEELAESR